MLVALGIEMLVSPLSQVVNMCWLFVLLQVWQLPHYYLKDQEVCMDDNPETLYNMIINIKKFRKKEQRICLDKKKK